MKGRRICCNSNTLDREGSADIEHTSRKVAGTQETRRQMRFDAHANRVRYGTAIFVTFSPDEAHNLLMIRLSRVRRHDPVLLGNETDRDAHFAERQIPSVAEDLSDDVVLGVPIQDMVPTYDERRRLMARDPLAAVDGFRTLVALAYQHLFLSLIHI